MENLGALAILLAFCAAVYAAAASVVGRLKQKPFLVVSGQRAVYAVWGLVTLAAGVLVYAMMTSDFRFAYVAEHSNRAMPTLYKFAAWWGGQEGSLLFWSWLLATYAMVVTFSNRRKHREMMPYVIAVLMGVQIFFLILNNFIANAFQMLATSEGQVIAADALRDGNGLNPLLQYPAMAIHPCCISAMSASRCRSPSPSARSSPASPGTAGSTPPAAGRWSLGSSKAAASCWARPGPTTCWAGAATGAGTRWRTRRCSPGSAARPFCTPS